MDSTWNIFTGILPISHIYERFNHMNIYYSSSYTFSSGIDIQFKGFDVVNKESKWFKYFIIILVVILVIGVIGYIVFVKFFKAPSSNFNNDPRRPFDNFINW